MIKLISCKIFLASPALLYIWPSISTAFVFLGSMVHFSGKRPMKNVIVNPKDGPQISLPLGIHALV